MVENDSRSAFLEGAIKESQSLRSSLDTTEQTIGLAVEANQRMGAQRGRLSSSRARLSDIISTVPVIGELSSKIQVRRKRDRLILGGLIGALMFFCVWYVFG